MRFGVNRHGHGLEYLLLVLCLFECPGDKPALLVVDDIAADGLAEDLLVTIGVEIVISHLECQAKPVTVVIQEIGVHFRGSAYQGTDLGRTGQEHGGLEADHLHVFLHGDLRELLEVHVHLLALADLRRGLGEEVQDLSPDPLRSHRDAPVAVDVHHISG